jgi:hypothetical protein
MVDAPAERKASSGPLLGTLDLTGFSAASQMQSAFMWPVSTTVVRFPLEELDFDAERKWTHRPPPRDGAHQHRPIAAEIMAPLSKEHWGGIVTRNTLWGAVL